MKRIARQLAAQGRYGDTQLMHVAPEELAALHGIGALMGRKITRNPSTGLPEAFNFRSLIPAIAGLGATVLSGGTLSPLTAGLISGATTAATGGNLQQSLLSGLSGGAIANLGQGFMGMAGASPEAAGAAAGEAINPAAHFSDAAFSANQAAAAPVAHFSDAAFSAGLPSAASSAPFSAAMQPASEYAAMPAAQAAASGPSMSTFMGNVKNPDAWSQQFMGGNLMTRTAPGVLALADSVGGAMTPSFDSGSSSGGGEPSDNARREHKQTRSMTPASDPYYAMHGGEHTYFGVPQYHFAGGGIVSLPNGQQADSGTLKAVRAIRSRYRSRKDAVDDMKVQGSFMQQLGVQDPNDPILDYAFGYTSKQGQHRMRSGDMSMPMGFADGGDIPDDGFMDVGVKMVPVPKKPGKVPYLDMSREQMHELRNQSAPGMPVMTDRGVVREQVKVPASKAKYMATGGAVNGPGDGMSDSVPAVINNRQPARLASDEFVVPADVVSGIGNGSSKAGHEQLYDMIARVRAARTGRTQQPPAVNAKKVMPK